MLNSIKDNIELKTNKKRFVEAVINKEIKIIEVKKNIVYEKMDSLKIPRDVYKNTSSDSYSLEEIKKLNDSINKLTEDYKTLELVKEEDMWLKDLEVFEKQYLKKNK